MPGPDLSADPPRPSAWSTDHHPLRSEVDPSDPARSVLVVPGSTWPLNPNGAVHGGMVTAAAARGAMVAAGGGRPSTLAVAFHRPAMPPLAVESAVLGRSDALALVAGTVRAADGRVCATAQVSLSQVSEHLDPHAGPHPHAEQATLGDAAPLLPPPAQGDPASWSVWLDSLPVSRFVGLRSRTATRTGFTAVVDHPGDPSGRVPEELIAAWADHCFGLAAYIAGSPESTPATASLTTQHLAAARGPLTLETTTLKSGRTLAFVHVDVHDAHRVLVAVADGTMSVDGSSPGRNPVREA